MTRMKTMMTPKIMGLAAKLIKQQKFSRAKVGDFDDELQDEEEDEEGAQNIVWSGNRSHDYHGGDRGFYSHSIQYFVIKQQKFLRAKVGDFDDELQDEEEDEEGAQNIVWSGIRSHDYHKKGNARSSLFNSC
ncbi:hypothetical protein OIU77_004765 [Salix suchowensis]|uniref:Uncharacterized protein n=1 Tax=Salix suchowensis TaxID=1278906 RepID=A0ABQ9AVG9_9ROSI|nr:hypothetical protein OIU77_004765 [Salix suchowensis]